MMLLLRCRRKTKTDPLLGSDAGRRRRRRHLLVAAVCSLSSAIVSPLPPPPPPPPLRRSPLTRAFLSEGERQLGIHSALGARSKWEEVKSVKSVCQDGGGGGARVKSVSKCPQTDRQTRPSSKKSTVEFLKRSVRKRGLRFPASSIYPPPNGIKQAK
jgi:hypothetical protein